MTKLQLKNSDADPLVSINVLKIYTDYICSRLTSDADNNFMLKTDGFYHQKDDDADDNTFRQQ